MYSKIVKKYAQYLDVVLQMLRYNKLSANGKKFDFVQQEIELLGHVMTRDEIRLDMMKVEAVQKSKQPSIKKMFRFLLA